MSFYEKIRPLIYKLESEKAHNIAIKFMGVLHKIPILESAIASSYCHVYESLSQEICGMKFYNPVGLSSGFDKNAEVIRPMASFGFGFLELGSVTQMPQDGNPKPRVFRHVAEESIQNAMGFNNIGARGMLINLHKHYPFCIPLGINIGKNKNLALSDSLKNYELSLQILKNHGDYFTFNLSSPNTPSLRDLQNEDFITELLDMARGITKKPLFIKISPDMDIDSMLKVCDKAISCGVSGIIATNTTTDYSLLPNPFKKEGQNIGGLSGKVLCEKSREILRILGQNFFGKTILISVGGISDATEAYIRFSLGANLVQIMSAMIYSGPSLIRRINKELDAKIRSNGFKHISEIIGTGIHHV